MHVKTPKFITLWVYIPRLHVGKYQSSGRQQAHSVLRCVLANLVSCPRRLPKYRGLFFEN